MIHCKTIIECPISKRPKERAKRKKRAERKKLMSKFPLTYKRDPKDERDFNFKTLLMESPITATAKIDHTKGMAAVRDQGQLGSCVGFAVAAMKEWQEKKEHEAELAKGKRGRPKVYNYSEAWIYWNSKKLDPWGIEEEGTSIRYAMQVLRNIGVPTEKGWPYKDINNVDAIGKPEGWANLVARWSQIESYWRLNSLTELKVALNLSPVPIGVGCFLEIFYVGDNGIVAYPNNPNNMYGGHAVCAVGYDDTTQLVKFKNSWGRNWGEKGYGYLPYSYINDFMWDAWTSKDLAVTTDMLKGTRELV